MRHCSRCDTDKPDQSFGPGHKTWCRKCHAEYQVKWRRGEREARRRKFPNDSGEITCSMCGVSGAEHFSPSIVAKGRKSGYCSKCMVIYYNTKENPDGSRYMQEFQRRLRAKKRAYVEERKVALGCRECGERHPACLELHHRDPSKKDKDLAKMCDTNTSWERMDAEIEKCDVLCSNCHRKHHYNEKRAKKEA